MPGLPIRLLPTCSESLCAFCLPTKPSEGKSFSPLYLFSSTTHTSTSTLTTATSFIQQVCTMASNRSNQYRCAVGDEWKDISEFSRSQQRRARNNNRENSGMICLAHSQPSRAEITCTVCCRTRPIEQYSNNERKSENPRCQQCVAWDTDQEHGVTPIPLATGHISIEEDDLKRYREPLSCSEFFKHELPEVSQSREAYISH